MTWTSFHTRVPGKWVLAGEHAVLRGAPAVALPHPTAALEFTFQPQVWDGLQVSPPHAQETLEALLDILEMPSLRGQISIESTIPQGAGLGSSAALCVALAQWWASQQSITQPDDKIAELARKLENHFHGQSSGMDIAAVMAKGPIRFSKEGGGTEIPLKNLSYCFAFHDTGLRASTRDCISQVEMWRNENPVLASKVDVLMTEASQQAEKGLRENNTAAVVRAMELSWDCFEHWGLLTPEIRQKAQKITDQGALAVKLTGAGRGGFLVALLPHF